LDKTLFRQAALTEAAKPLGISTRWNQYDELYKKKRITLAQCLVQQFRLLSGMKLANVLHEVSKLETMRNIRETVEKLQGHRIHVIILTDNPDFLCQYLVEKYGFNGFVSSKVAVKDGIIAENVEPLPDKRLGIRKYCAWLSIPLRKSMHIGDGPNDVPVFRVVGYSIALNSKIERVVRAASMRIETADMLDVYNKIQPLISEGLSPTRLRG
jgi:HAD superfamily phosphoserine phosphatase-like hydrolase